MSLRIWLESAILDIGIKEPDPKIEIYHASTGKAADYKTSWCASFVNYHIVNAGLTGIQSLLARDWLKWGLPCSAIPGAVAILERGTEPWQGHVGFLIKETPKTLFILGGNQDNRVCVQPYSKTKLIGFRWPGEKEGFK